MGVGSCKGTLMCPIQDPAAGQDGPSIHLAYLSGWTRAFVHYNVDGRGESLQQLCDLSGMLEPPPHDLPWACCTAGKEALACCLPAF